LPELLTVLRHLRLGQLVACLPERLALAEKEGLSHEEFLLGLLTDEVERRRSSATARRASIACLDPDMVVERWDPSARVTYDKRTHREIMTLRFVQTARNVIVLGPVGVGKTFLGTAVGHVACAAGYSVWFSRTDALLQQLRQSRMDNSRETLMVELCSVDLLILDDFAIEPMNRDESRDMYQLFVERNARCSTIITSNRDTADWLAVFDDPLQGQSAIDRFRNNAYDLIIEGESYRPRQKPNVDQDGPPPAAPVTKTHTSPRSKRRTPRRRR
jgi:DNA replication protein DnaC